MHVIIFEVYPKQGKADDYFELAAELKPLLEEQPGFIAVERFQSLNDSQKYLSISSWESEEAIKNWRENIEHQQAQNAGKTSIFSKYRIRVAEVVRDYDFHGINNISALSGYQLDAKGNTDAEYDMGCAIAHILSGAVCFVANTPLPIHGRNINHGTTTLAAPENKSVYQRCGKMACMHQHQIDGRIATTNSIMKHPPKRQFE